MNIYGGNVRIDGTVLSVDLSWTNLSDSFYAKDISYGVEIAEDKTFYDEDGNAYSGTIDSDATTETSPIGGKTLRPLTNVLVLNDDADNTAAISGSTGQRNVILQGRRLDAQPTKAGVYIHGGCKVVVP